jgi:hypothetical protein
MRTGQSGGFPSPDQIKKPLVFKLSSVWVSIVGDDCLSVFWDLVALFPFPSSFAGVLAEDFFSLASMFAF